MDVSKRGWRNQTILVVEDGEAIRKMVCSMLSQSGYDCIEAEHGVEALQYLRRQAHKVNLVLTDVVMPQMGGLELARHAARIEPQLRFLFMSGYNDDPMVQETARSPVFLAKPFTVSELMDKIRHALDRPPTNLPEARSGSGAS